MLLLSAIHVGKGLGAFGSINNLFLIYKLSGLGPFTCLAKTPVRCLILDASHNQPG